MPPPSLLSTLPHASSPFPHSSSFALSHRQLASFAFVFANIWLCVRVCLCEYFQMYRVQYNFNIVGTIRWPWSLNYEIELELDALGQTDRDRQCAKACGAGIVCLLSADIVVVVVIVIVTWHLALLLCTLARISCVFTCSTLSSLSSLSRYLTLSSPSLACTYTRNEMRAQVLIVSQSFCVLRAFSSVNRFAAFDLPSLSLSLLSLFPYLFTLAHVSSC